MVLPILRRNSRLRNGIEERTSSDHLEKADIWIQGASAGESYLAIQLVAKLFFERDTKILLTSTTAQGIDAYSDALHKSDRSSRHISIQTSWFPFDIPDLMDQVMRRVQPSLIVLVETELWPALIHSAEKYGVKTIIVNGRISERSFRRYSKVSWLCRAFSPDAVFAISEADAKRFSTLFPGVELQVVPNMKFDTVALYDRNCKYDAGFQITSPLSSDPAVSGLTSSDLASYGMSRIIPSGTPFSILASIRREEEDDASSILDHILSEFPGQVVGLFPRHMHRLDSWKKMLSLSPHRWQLRSETCREVPTGTVILWDLFGELKSAYSLGTTAFVGGSLCRAGGHNFVESFISGAATVTGPHVDEFAWVGEEIFSSGMVYKADNAEQVAEFMVRNLKDPPDRIELIRSGSEYVSSRLGGTEKSCSVIQQYISDMGKHG